jgi:deoxyribodipyrimidine photo-lyase
VTNSSIISAPTRLEGFQRLAAFVPSAGRAYASKRNYDFGVGRHENVSTVAPYIRHRLITEDEVIRTVLQAHTLSAADKFIQEVCWRTYWKGWLEQHPQIWTKYLEEVAAQRQSLRDDDATAAEIAAAERGDTGVECFDAWVSELVETGYLHNHARMWFASIWIFTLKLPWALGADFFLRHLLDGDPASNTLSWRRVAGLQTRGKTYLARADNIAEYTGGRFQPSRDELASFAEPLSDEPEHERTPLRPPHEVPKGQRAILLITEEDLSPETWTLADLDICGVAMFAPIDDALQWAPPVRAFKTGAMIDAANRAAEHWLKPVFKVTTSDELIAFAAKCGASVVITTTIPVGFVKPDIEAWTKTCKAAGLPLLQMARRWDSLFWPHATAGFFKFKERIPSTLAKLKLQQPERST